jgi:hypothetical protein
MTEYPKIGTALVKATNLNLEGLDDLFNAPRLSKPEMHLLLKPFFVLDRHANRFEPIKYEYTAMHNGAALNRRWWVLPHTKYGLPGPFDRDVAIALYELVNENYFAKALPVPEMIPIGSFRDFAERMGINPSSGKNTAAIKESFERLKTTLIDSVDQFFHNKKKRYISIRLTLLKAVLLAGEEDDDGGKYEQNYVMFDETILSNLNSGYVMVLDVQRISELKTNIAKQLYAHLAYRFYREAQDGSQSWTADYDWLAVHLGIKVWTELRRAKTQLKEAHEELKQLGYISKYQWDDWRITYWPGDAWKGEQMRRQSGSTRRSRGNGAKQLTLDLQPTKVESHDPLLPALAAFAGGLPVGQERIKALGLSEEQAKALCLEKNITPLAT